MWIRSLPTTRTAHPISGIKRWSSGSERYCAGNAPMNLGHRLRFRLPFIVSKIAPGALLLEKQHTRPEPVDEPRTLVELHDILLVTRDIPPCTSNTSKMSLSKLFALPLSSARTPLHTQTRPHDRGLARSKVRSRWQVP